MVTGFFRITILWFAEKLAFTNLPHWRLSLLFSYCADSATEDVGAGHLRTFFSGGCVCLGRVRFYIVVSLCWSYGVLAFCRVYRTAARANIPSLALCISFAAAAAFTALRSARAAPPRLPLFRDVPRVRAFALSSSAMPVFLFWKRAGGRRKKERRRKRRRGDGLLACSAAAYMPSVLWWFVRAC